MQAPILTTFFLAVAVPCSSFKRVHGIHGVPAVSTDQLSTNQLVLAALLLATVTSEYIPIISSTLIMQQITASLWVSPAYRSFRRGC